VPVAEVDAAVVALAEDEVAEAAARRLLAAVPARQVEGLRLLRNSRVAAAEAVRVASGSVRIRIRAT